MRVGFVTQWFPPEPAGVPADMADGLAERGHDIDVVTGFPNYPSGRLAEGYRVRPYVRERRSERVTVHRAPLFPSHDAAAARRAANYASFALGATSVLPRLPRPDVWLTYSSPVTATLPALVSRGVDRLRGARPIPHAQVVQDLWPDSVVGSGLVTPGPALAAAERVIGAYCDRCYRESAAIGVISPSMRAILTSRGVPDHVVLDTPNWVSVAAAPPRVTGRANRRELGLPDGRLFLYAGNLGELQALDDLVAAFGRLAQQPAPSTSGTASSDLAAQARPGTDPSPRRRAEERRLVLMGEGVARARLERAARALPNVDVLPAVPADRVAAYLAAADVLVVSLADTPLLRATMPSKVQTCLATGRPILAHAAGDAAQVVVEAGAGVAGAPGDAVAVDAVLRELIDAPDARLDAMGAAGRRAFETRFSRSAGLDALERLLEQARASAAPPVGSGGHHRTRSDIP